MQRFANAAHVTEGWYVLARSKSLRRGAILTVAVGDKEVVVYRRHDGIAGALDAACGHLGAHMGRGTLTPDGVQCAYHGWCWGPDGACTATPHHEKAPGRRMRAYDTEERVGLVWAWLGRSRAAYPPPDAGAPSSWRALVLRPQIVKAHPHLVLGNGFDLGHLAPAHGFALDGDPSVKVDGARMEMTAAGTLPRVGSLRLSGLGGKRFESAYTTLGGSATLVDVRAPIEFRVLFTGRPDENGHTRAQTVLFAPRRRDFPRAFALLWTTTLQDIRIMESLDAFHPAFDASDEVLATYAKLVEGLPTW